MYHVSRFMDAAILTEGLTKHFGARTAVDNLNLQVRPGEIFGFLGPNGAGKTTTIGMLLGLVRPSAGRAVVLGHDIQRQPAEALRRVGAMVESPSFYPYLSGRDNLRVLARAGGLAESRVAVALDLVELADRARDKVKGYSQGMRQRLGIAAALLHEPQLIILDEPTNGLDPAGQHEIRELIRTLAQSGRTVFLSSHLLHEVEQVCAEVAIIDKGRLVAQGSVAQLTSQGAALLVEAEPLPIVRQIAERLGAASEERGARSVALSLAPERAPELTAALVHAGAQIFQITPQRSSLEQLFLNLTGEPEQRANGQEQAPASIALAPSA